MKREMNRALLVFFAAAASLAAQDSFLAAGFDHFYNLEYDEALADFSKSLALHPDDPNRQNHVAQTVLYRAMFNAGALESELVTGSNPFLRRDKVNPSPEEQKRFDDAITRSLALCDARLKRNPNDVDALYAQGVAYGLRANYNFLVRKSWMDSLKDATQARKAHNKVTELDPSVVDARLIQGLHDYIVGSLPFTYRLFGFLIGFHGDREQGIKELQLVAEKGNRNKYDAQILLGAVYRREHRAADTIPIIQGLLQRFPRNYLIRFELAQMYADLGQKDAALRTLREVEALKRSGASGYKNLPAEKIYFHIGNLQFWYNDFPDAVDNLRKVTVKAGELDLNTGVLAWMRLGQIYDLMGKRLQAREAYQKAIDLAPQSELARESRRYLGSPYKRG